MHMCFFAPVDEQRPGMFWYHVCIVFIVFSVCVLQVFKPILLCLGGTHTPKNQRVFFLCLSCCRNSICSDKKGSFRIAPSVASTVFFVQEKTQSTTERAHFDQA